MDLHEELQQFIHVTYVQRRQWMLRQDVRQEVEQVFSLNSDDARTFLALMFVHAEKEAVLNAEVPLDGLLRHMVQELYDACLDYCLTIPNNFQELFHRCKEVFGMWKDRDHAAVCTYVRQASMEESLRTMYLRKLNCENE